MLPYPEVLYKIRPQDGALQQALLVTSAHEPTSPHHHILPPHLSPPRSPDIPTPASQPYRVGSESPTSPTVMFRSPSQIIYKAAPTTGHQRVNPKEYYDSLPYPRDAYQVPISIPTSQVLYHIPRSSVSSEHSRNDSLQYSDTLSDQSDSSSSLRPNTKARDKVTRPTRMRDRNNSKSLYPSPPDGSRVSAPTPMYRTNSLKRQLYVTNNYGSKLKCDDQSVTSLIRPATTKKREITSAFAPLLANQKESEV